MTYFGGFTRTSSRNRLVATLVFAAVLLTMPMAHAAGPNMTRNPSSVAFGNVQISTTSFEQFISVQNTGDANLTIGTAALTGANADQFGVPSDSCSGQTLSQSQFCSISVEFSPTSTGLKTAMLSIPSDDPTPPGPVSLTGTGVNPQLTRNPSSLAYGNVQVGTTSFNQFISVQNTGTGNGPLVIGVVTITGPAAGEYAVTSDGCTNFTLSPSQFCSIAVALTPTSTGTKNATLSIPSNDPSSPATVALAGSGVSAQLTRNPSSIAFGNVQVGTTSFEQFVSVQNTGTGNGPLVIGNVTLTGTGASQFQITSDTCSTQTLGPSQFCSIEVVLAPTSAGAKSATLSIPSNDPSSPSTVSLSGSGVNPSLSRSPSSIGFGNVGIGSTSFSQFVSVQNSGTGNGPLNIGAVAVTGMVANQFQITNDTCSNVTLGPSQFCSVEVAFAPTTTGTKSATLSIPSNDPTGPATVSLSGTGIMALSISPASITFTSRELGTTSTPRTITVTNNGDDGQLLDAASLAGANPADFAIAGDECSNAFLFTGDSCQIDVTFAPQALGARAGTLEITSGSNTLSVALAGTGTDLTGPVTSWTTANNSVRVSTLQSVNGHATDASGVASVSVTFTDALGSPTTVTATLGPCTGVNKSCDFSAVVPLMLPGLYTAQIKAADTIGNLSTGPTITLIVI
jgi:hypothetical protein